VRGVLIRAAYALAPVVILGAVAFIAGPGRHRVAILALAVVLAVVLGYQSGETAEPGQRSAPPPAGGELPDAGPLLPEQARCPDSQVSRGR